MKWLSTLLGRAAKPSERQAETNLSNAFAPWLSGTVTPSDICRQFQQSFRAKELYNRAKACADVQVALNKNAEIAALSPIRLYKAGQANNPYGNVKAIKLSSRARFALRDVSLFGKSAMYAERAGPDIVEVTSHPLLDLLYKPNFAQSHSDFIQNVLYFLDLCGNMYIQPIYDGEDYPTSLLQLYPQNVNAAASVENFIDGYWYGASGMRPVWFDASDVDQFVFRRSKANPFEGTGWVENVLMEMEVLTLATASQISLWNNGGVPEKILQLDENYWNMTPEQLKSLETAFEQRYGGPRNKGKQLITAAIKGVLDVGSTPKDLQFIQVLQEYRKAVWRAAGIPESVMDSSGANAGNALAGYTNYARTAIQPRLANLAEQLTNKLLPRFGLVPGEYWLAYDNSVPVDNQFIQNTAVANVTARIWTVDEGRAVLGYAPLADGEGAKLVNPYGLAPAPQAGELPPIDRIESSNEEDHPLARRENPETVANLPYTGAPESQPKPKAYAPDTDFKASELDFFWKSRAIDKKALRDVDAAVNGLTKAVRKWLQASSESQRFDSEALAESIAKPVEDLFSLGGKRGLEALSKVEGGKERVEALGVSWDVNNPERAKFLDSYRVRLSQRITEDQRSQLKEALQAAIDNGEPTRDATERVFEALSVDEKWKAERIARTESARTYSEGELRSWKETGVSRKRMIKSSGSCPVCDAIEAKFKADIELGSNFFAKGDSIQTSEGLFSFSYEDISAPPFHPHCRCSLVPVLDDSGEGKAASPEKENKQENNSEESNRNDH